MPRHHATVSGKQIAGSDLELKNKSQAAQALSANNDRNLKRIDVPARSSVSAVW